MFRLAEIYLTRAEAKYRLNGSQEGLADIQLVQDRANRQIKATSVDEQTLIDEWCREFFMEGRRRSDLVRFGLFTGSKYLWSFKGGVEKVLVLQHTTTSIQCQTMRSRTTLTCIRTQNTKLLGNKI